MNIKGVNNGNFSTASQHNVKKVEKGQDNTMQILKNEKPLEEENNKKINSEDREKLKEVLSKITEGLSEIVSTFNKKLDFVVHEGTHRMMVKVINTETNEVIKEIPPKEMLDLAAKIQETLSIFIDVKV